MRGALLMAAICTGLDFLWAARWIPDHGAIWGVLHGGILFLALGLFLGLNSGRPRAWFWGGLGGVVIGGGAAAAFYVLARFLGYATMLGLWVAVWILLGVLQGRLTPYARGARETALRGILAACVSVPGFYGVYRLWRRPGALGPDLLLHSCFWVLAFAAALLSLLVSRNTEDGSVV